MLIIGSRFCDIYNMAETRRLIQQEGEKQKQQESFAFFSQKLGFTHQQIVLVFKKDSSFSFFLYNFNQQLFLGVKNFIVLRHSGVTVIVCYCFQVSLLLLLLSAESTSATMTSVQTVMVVVVIGTKHRHRHRRPLTTTSHQRLTSFQTWTVKSKKKNSTSSVKKVPTFSNSRSFFLST